MPQRPVTFAVLIGVTALVAHAICFFLHEYSHATMAWLLGWKSSPFTLNYGPPTLANILFQQGIDENVDYAPIFAAHHGLQAALIAGAGPFLGNGAIALLCHRLITRNAKPGARDGSIATPWALLWIDAFATFNVWSYAPIRTLTTHADMATLARGLGVSMWAVFPAALLIGAWLLLRFCRVALPLAQARLDPRQPLGAILLGLCFPLYSAPGLIANYGPYCAALSVISLFMLFPLALITLERETREPPKTVVSPNDQPPG